MNKNQRSKEREIIEMVEIWFKTHKVLTKEHYDMLKEMRHYLKQTPYNKGVAK